MELMVTALIYFEVQPNSYKCIVRNSRQLYGHYIVIYQVTIEWIHDRYTVK